MTISWYSIRISPQTGGGATFNGYFSVDSTSNLVTGFYNYNNLEVNLLLPTGTGTFDVTDSNGFNVYDYNNFLYDNAYMPSWKQFDYNGVVLSNLPGYRSVTVNLLSTTLGGETSSSSGIVIFIDNPEVGINVSFNIHPISSPSSENIPVSNACFPQKTPITTNQGIIPIEHIDISKHTIRNKKIVAITKTVTQDKYMVCFEKDSLGENIPCDKTIISKNHMIFYKGKMRTADYFTSAKFKNVNKVNYSGEILYNVLLEDYDKMIVNNLICETLHPNNYLAKLYRILKIFETDIGKNACIKEMNRCYHRAKQIQG